jgi:hypothetical protein
MSQGQLFSVAHMSVSFGRKYLDIMIGVLRLQLSPVLSLDDIDYYDKESMLRLRSYLAEHNVEAAGE